MTALLDPPTGRTITSRVDDLVGRAEALVADLDGNTLDADLARRLVEHLGRAERIISAGVAIAARRVADSNGWTREGDRSPAHFLARTTGTSVSAAQASLDTAAQLDHLPELDSALRTGKVSPAQAKEIAAASTAAPPAERKLIELASNTSLGGLKSECARVKAAAEPDPNEQHRKIHRTRRFRHWTEADGAFAFSGRTTVEQGARLLAAMKPLHDKIFGEARKAERRESRDAYAMDALIALAEGSAGGRSARHSGSAAAVAARPDQAQPAGPKALVHVRIDHAALVRGRAEHGETCEIPGIGPVPVATVKKMMNDAFLAAIVTDGVDVRTVAHMGRTIPAHLRTALIERDPRCRVPGCNATEHLEIDHIVPFAEGGPTRLENLVRLCSFHHDQKTYEGFRLTGPAEHPGWTRTGPRRVHRYRRARTSRDRSPPRSPPT